MMIVNFSESRFIAGGRISYSEINDFFRKKVSRLFTFLILNGHIIVTFMKINEYEYKWQWHSGYAEGKSTERISDADGEIPGKRILAYSPTGGFAWWCTGFLVSRVTQDTAMLDLASCTGLSPSVM